uniref:Uncharacterized protein n=1 Tax=Arundo donax TaxID=35708 RepID=A0A0A9FCF7_ARUDO
MRRLAPHPLDLLLVFNSGTFLLLWLFCRCWSITAKRAYHTLRMRICFWYTTLETHPQKISCIFWTRVCSTYYSFSINRTRCHRTWRVGPICGNSLTNGN